MAKEDVLILAQELAQGNADPVQLDKYYTEVVNEISNKGFFTATRFVDRNSDNRTYTKPEDMNRILQVFYGDTALNIANIQELVTFGQDWRLQRGKPFAYTFQGEDAGTFRLFPIPDQPAGPNDFSGAGEPEGLDFPNYAVTVICTLRKKDVQPYLDLPIALSILKKEFTRESTHTDTAFAELCEQIAGLMLEVV